jgi:hypothetical protein
MAKRKTRDRASKGGKHSKATLVQPARLVGDDGEAELINELLGIYDAMVAETLRKVTSEQAAASIKAMGSAIREGIVEDLSHP